jgi:transcription factor C subunit 3
MEFALLSIIASRQSSGISQPELIKLSGQDKRSVPKRTDVLQRKGYIEKRAIQMKAARTSLCTLRKFLKPDHHATEGPTAESTPTGTDAVTMIDFRSFTDKLFRILREYQIISRSDLKDVLGFNDRWRWKVLSRALRKFERIGVLKRVRALSQYAETQRKYHPCVMLVREPSERDIELFHDFSRNIYSNMEQSGDAEFDDDAEADDRGGEPSSTEKVHAVGREEDVEVSGRILPLWSPDRSIHNQLFEVVDRTGTTGCANSVSICAIVRICSD